jgi:antirestriction protein
MTPKIYFADLAAYNNGRLRGVWVEFFEGIEPDDVQFAIDAMLQDSEGEEWRIDDREHFADFESFDLEKLCQVAALIHEHGEGAMKGYLSHRGSDADLDEFTDYYIGCFKSEVAFCEEHFQIAEAAEQIQVFDWATLDQYIDWEAIANDAFINSYYSHKARHEEIHVYVRE